MFLPQEQRKVRARRVQPVVAFTTESSELSPHDCFSIFKFRIFKFQTTSGLGTGHLLQLGAGVLGVVHWREKHLVLLGCKACKQRLPVRVASQ
jgi:hypothetical protein